MLSKFNLVLDEASNEEIRDFAGELKLMMHIGEHKNIVNLLGVCYKESKLHGILEFCPYGNLREFLQSKRNLYEPTWVKTNYDEDEVLTLANQVTIAQNICEGMQFLASQKVRATFFGVHCITLQQNARIILERKLCLNILVDIFDFQLFTWNISYMLKNIFLSEVTVCIENDLFLLMKKHCVNVLIRLMTFSHQLPDTAEANQH